MMKTDVALLTEQRYTAADLLTEYISTSHDAVEIGGDGLHYHYGTLGQLEHGVNYAEAYLRTIGKKTATERPLKSWPYPKGGPVKLFILAGHRNMEGERAFTQELKTLKGHESLANDNAQIAFKYSVGGGFKTSAGWEPLGPAGPYDTFGPELSLAQTLQGKVSGNIAIAKFTHSGSQMNDWTPEGTTAKDMHQYDKFIAFIRGASKTSKIKVNWPASSITSARTKWPLSLPQRRREVVAIDRRSQPSGLVIDQPEMARQPAAAFGSQRAQQHRHHCEPRCSRRCRSGVHSSQSL